MVPSFIYIYNNGSPVAYLLSPFPAAPSRLLNGDREALACLHGDVVSQAQVGNVHLTPLFLWPSPPRRAHRLGSWKFALVLDRQAAEVVHDRLPFLDLPDPVLPLPRGDTTSFSFRVLLAASGFLGELIHYFSRLKLPDFMRGGNSLKVESHLSPRTPAPGPIRRPCRSATCCTPFPRDRLARMDPSAG